MNFVSYACLLHVGKDILRNNNHQKHVDGGDIKKCILQCQCYIIFTGSDPFLVVKKIAKFFSEITFEN